MTNEELRKKIAETRQQINQTQSRKRKSDLRRYLRKLERKEKHV